MIGISPVSYANALATSKITPAYTTAVQPIHRIEPIDSSFRTPIIDTPSKTNKEFDATLNSYIQKYQSMQHIDSAANTPYEQANKAFESSIVTGMNFDMSI